MKEKPILFSGPMVRAILSGRKTQTRRVVRDCHLLGGPPEEALLKLCLYGKPGDRLWVREEHAIVAAPGLTTGAKEVEVEVQFLDGERRCASLTAAELQKLRERRAWSLGDETRGRFMYRSLSRITLEIVSVRVERLQDISEADATAEGVQSEWSDDGGESPGRYLYFTDADRAGVGHAKPSRAYRVLWESINGAGSWDANPWVWVVEFKKL
ncbi:MAG: hypothetical protein KCHDKBKB_03019 [Elusimicrobia bacterium]|nr:hypothetical protein [Elusimicrobiota bacterium]